MKSNQIKSNLVQSDSIRFNPIQSDAHLGTKSFLNKFNMCFSSVHRCSVPLFFCPPNFGRSSSSSPQSLSQSTFHRAPSKGHNICSRKVCSSVFSRVFFCFVKKDWPLVTVCDNFVTICVPSLRVSYFYILS